MKTLILITLFFCSSSCFSQQTCPPGYEWMPSISTSSLSIIADTCLPDTTVKKLFLEFRKNMCGEVGSASIGGIFSYIKSPKWVNDSIGCVITETFKKMVKGKYVEISKCRYYYENKCVECGTWDENEKYKIIPCCGHVHKMLPE